MSAYLRPTDLKEALKLRAEQDLTILAGGTDVFPNRTNREAWGGIYGDTILDISALPGLNRIERRDGQWRIGALVTWSSLAGAGLPAMFDGLKRAAVEVGGRQIQNRGTLAGNLCNASPAADGVPPLLTLNAEVELTSLAGARRLPLAEFVDGYRHTQCRRDEILTALLVPELPDTAVSHFLKLGARHYLVISIAMVAAVLVPDAHGRIGEARLAIGACSAVARRLPALEAALVGKKIAPGLEAAVEASQFDALSPIDDVRASADYRAAAARELTGELLAQIGSGALRRIT
jgi:N-methylhydantoinase B